MKIRSVPQPPRYIRSLFVGIAIIALLGALVFVLAPSPSANAMPALSGTLSVSTTNDVVDGDTSGIVALLANPGADSAISLREAVVAANHTTSTPSSPNIINMPTGIYNLTTGELQLGNATNRGTNLVGADAATTIIHQTLNTFRIFNLDPDVDGGVAIKISDVTLENGVAQSFGGGAILGGGAGDALTLTNVVVRNNTTSGFTSAAGISWSPAGDVTINNSAISNNVSGQGAGALLFSSNGALTISNSTFSNNTAGSTGSAGGALLLGGGGTYNITGSTFTNNQGIHPSSRGGAVFVGSGALNASFNRIVGNTANQGGGIFAANGANTNVTNNWWGCNAGPNNAGCDSINNQVNADPWLVLRISASPTTVLPGGTSNLSADVTHNSNNVDTSGGGHISDTTPLTFSASGGTIAPTQTTTTNGAASALYTAGNTSGNFNASASVDNQTVSVDLTIPAPTATNTPLPSNTPTETPTNTPSDTPTDTPTNTPENTATATLTNTPQNTPTNTPSNTPSNTATFTPTNTPTKTNTPTATSTPCGLPAAPTLQLPPNGSTIQGRSALLTWSAVTCATSYNVTVHMKSPTGPVKDSATGLTTTSHQTGNLPPNKTYYWQVEACNSVGCTASVFHSFDVPNPGHGFEWQSDDWTFVALLDIAVR